MLAQFVAQSVEDCFALRGETPKDEYRLLSDGVDDVADFRIIEQEIDELRDLDVVDGDGGLILICDDQVLLLGSLQLYAPCGYAVDATVGEVCTRKVGMVEARPEEVSPAEVRPAEVCLAEARLAEVRLVEVRTSARVLITP